MVLASNLVAVASNLIARASKKTQKEPKAGTNGNSGISPRRRSVNKDLQQHFQGSSSKEFNVPTTLACLWRFSPAWAASARRYVEIEKLASLRNVVSFLNGSTGKRLASGRK